MTLQLPKTLLSFEKCLAYLVLPVTGIIVPFLLGFLDNQPVQDNVVGYFFCVAVSFLIWFGSRSIFVKLRAYNRISFSYPQFVLLYTLCIIIYSFFVSFISLHFVLRKLFHIDGNLIVPSILPVFIALFISAIYEVIILYDETSIKKLENEKLEKGKMEVELNILKSKIEPHFLFNSLNTLQNLIAENTPAAYQFNRLLSALYRDLLLLSERNLLALDQELDLMYKYHNLLLVRFPSAIKLSVMLQNVNLEKCFLPPFSLQILLENAVKHNTFSHQAPLEICITTKSDYLIFCNRKTTAFKNANSTKTGLKLLARRIEISLHEKMQVEANENSFSVCLPLKKIPDYEGVDH